MSKNRILFGPAGIPLSIKGSGSIEGVKECANLGLTAMELEFVQGVRMKEDTATQVAKVAKELDISISSHAPYYVNLCTNDELKIKNTYRHILESARITSLCGGNITVFHPGFYQKLTPEEAFREALKNLKIIEEKMKENKIKIRLGAETVGKKGAFGGLMENIKLTQELEFVEPAIDFAHLHARGDFKIHGEKEYKQIFDLLEKELGDYVKRFHAHFSEINYGDKGEKNHLVLGANNEPPFKPLMKVLAENGYSGTIICESPDIEKDALKMQKEFEELVRK